MAMVNVRHHATGQVLPHLSWNDWRTWRRRTPPEGVWIACMTCWGQGRILSPAANGEGRIPIDCWTCIGIGSVPA